MRANLDNIDYAYAKTLVYDFKIGIDKIIFAFARLS
jgi:hypothetical protein